MIPLVEDARDWERLKEGVRTYLGVEGELEVALADRISTLMWRLYRVVRFESGAVEQYLKDVPRDFQLGRKLSGLPAPSKVTREVVEEMDRMLTQRLLPGDETLEKVMRYESRLHRFLLQTLHQLLVVKGFRRPGGRYFGIPDLDPGLPRRDRPPRLEARTEICEREQDEQ